MEQEEQDRTEPATPYKLNEARKRGQVAKSTEFNSLIVLTVMLIFILLGGARAVEGFLRIAAGAISQAHGILVEPASAIALSSLVFGALVEVFGPLLLFVLAAAALGNFAQTGPVFSFHPVKPDFQRINPMTGLKRIFSVRLLYEAAKTLLKIALFGTVVTLFVRHVLPQMYALVDVPAKSYGAILLDIATRLMFAMLMVVVVIAILDLIYTRWEFQRKMRMSRRELKDEIKRREGDPRIRARLRELQREVVKRAGSIRKVPDADVIITNPTRLAVALQYDPENMRAPIVVAKGAGLMADSIRVVGRTNGVPLAEDRALTQSIFQRIGIGEPIHQSHFEAAARIIVWAFTLRDDQILLAGQTP